MDLRAWMATRSLSNAEFAALVGVAENTVSRWRNRTRRPRGEDLRQIMSATDGAVTANDFYAPLPAPASRVAATPTEAAA